LESSQTRTDTSTDQPQHGIHGEKGQTERPQSSACRLDDDATQEHRRLPGQDPNGDKGPVPRHRESAQDTTDQ
jgi:hypothetical protein